MNLTAIFALTIIGLGGCLAVKLRIGPSLLVSSFVLLVLSQKLGSTEQILINVATLPLFYWVLAVIGGVSILGSLLKHLNKVPKLVVALESILQKKSLVITSLPTIIGALPMPGGAYLSAPMVEKAGKGTSLSREKMTAINHWYRHLLEFFLPLYPGYILAVKLCGLSTLRFSLHTIPLAIAGAIIGGVILLRNEDLPSCETTEPSPYRLLCSALWPIMVVLIPSILGMPFLLALYASIIATATRYTLHNKVLWSEWLNRAFNLNMVVMITGIFLFKECIEATGLRENLAPELAALGLPVMGMIILIPAIAGLLAGLGVGFVGISYPILLPLITINGTVSLPLAVLVYACGWVGMMLSPAHLCLILTTEYFEAKMTKVLSYLMTMGAIMIIFAIVMTNAYARFS